MKFEKIYLEGNEFFIKLVLEIARKNLGDSCDVINLVPELKEDEE